MNELERPMVNRELYRRYKRGDLGKEELADFLYQMAKATLDAELKEMKNREEQRFLLYVHDTNRLIRSAIALILHDKEGFGKTRLTRVLLALHEIIDSYAKGYIDIDDMENTVEHECKIKFKDCEVEKDELSE